jgi:sucrose phosphorylase
LKINQAKALLRWAKEKFKRVQNSKHVGMSWWNTSLDLKGKLVNGVYNKGLLEDSEIEGIMSTIMERGGRVKNLYDPSGNKISYYQVKFF